MRDAGDIPGRSASLIIRADYQSFNALRAYEITTWPELYADSG